MGKTPIQWTDESVNPIRFRNRETGKVGHFCEKISPGCKNCYSDKMQTGPYLSGLSFLAENKDKGDLFFEPKVLQVLRRKKPTKYFWCDMTDLFGSWVPDEWIDRCFATMAQTPWHTHQVLTKRADRMAGYGYPRRGVLPNVWLGVSVEDQQRADERIPLLLQTPAAVRFLSVEPLLGPVDLAPWLQRGEIAPGGVWPGDVRRLLHWVIVGGESGPGARPCSVEWIRSIVQQCKAAGVACFVKQLGHDVREGDEEALIQSGNSRCWPLETGWSDIGETRRVLLDDRKGGDPAEWPTDLRVREMPQQGEAHRPDGRGASNT